MAVSERYDRQGRIKGWEQEKLNGSEVYLIGSGILSDFLLVDLLSMGIGKIFRVGSSDSFDFAKINPEVYLEQSGEELSSMVEANRLIGNGAVIDATNDIKSKYFSSVIARKRKQPFFSCSANRHGFSFCHEKHEEQLIDFHLSEVKHGEFQGLLNSMVCSAITADELRKVVMPIPDDIRLEEFRYGKIKEPDGNCLEKRVIQIGAGAIGTFSGIALAIANSRFTLVDYDRIEPTNLNRQFLFYDSLGKNKAEVLAERLARYNRDGKITSVDRKINADFHPKNYDFMFSCVDNNLARYFMNNSAWKYDIALINGGSSVNGCNAMPYVPGKTMCLDCQMGLELSRETDEPKKEEKRKPGACFHPSLIIPNQISGALMASCMNNCLNGVYTKQEYLSGLGISEQKVEGNCFSSCKISVGAK
jgi:molybdopterin/thiamine biosynthesis adenylyltransferase